jgi:hypothetical protein
MALVLVASLWLAACSSASSPHASSPSTTGVRSTTTSTTVRSSTRSTSATPATLEPQTQTATEFLSPSRNISCEIDDHLGPSAITSASCLTISPPKSVTLGTDGTLTECSGTQCLSNAGEETPTLEYGQSVSLGPFACSSSTAGVKCTLGNGDGFQIATSGVSPLGDAKLGGSGSPG